MARFPTSPGDNGVWDSVIQAYLLTEHSSAGVHTRAVPRAGGTATVVEPLPVYQAADYGAVGNGTTDDKAAVQAAHDACKSAGGGILALTPGGSHKIASGGLVFDPGFVQVRGINTKIDGSGMAANSTAVTLQSTLSTPYNLNAKGPALAGVEVVGSGTAGSITGLLTVGTSGAPTAGLWTENVVLHDLSIGLMIGSNSYINTFAGMAVYNCNHGLDDTADSVNGGERITFIGCDIFNNTGRGFHFFVGPSDYVFDACSFDFNGAMGHFGAGVHITAVGCHIEMNGAQAVSGHLFMDSGPDTTFVMHGGVWSQHGATTGGAFAITPTDAASLAVFRDVAFEGVSVTDTDNFITGAGRANVDVINPLCDSTSASLNFGAVHLTRLTNVPQSVVVGGGAVPASATVGFLYIPTCVGTPSGVPETHAGTGAVVYNTTSHNLNIYDPVAASWYHVAMTVGAG